MTNYEPAVAGLTLVHQGKTRDTFATEDPNLLLVVATDRLSTHNVVHQSLVQHKGEVLTAMTICWAALLKRHNVTTHLVACGQKIYQYLPPGVYPGDLHLRAIIVKRLTMIPVEYILRAYLAGSLYEIYKTGRDNPYGIALPPGMQLMDAFPEPVFTPTEKSDTDPPMLAAEVISRYPNTVELVTRTYEIIRRKLRARRLEAVDTKFELGYDAEQNIVVADEIVTPDSSRFTRIGDIERGIMPPWLDKQVFRDEAERQWKGGAKVPLVFSHEALYRGARIYRQLFEDVMGVPLATFHAKFFSR